MLIKELLISQMFTGASNIKIVCCITLQSLFIYSNCISSNFLTLTEPVNVTVSGNGILQTSFEPTEIMSTYLLAFVVCDFGYIGTETGADVLVIIIITVYALIRDTGSSISVHF